MCGINIIFDKQKRLDSGTVAKMNQSTQHRGPDHHGLFQMNFDTGMLYFGANRLKIIGLQDEANQPMKSADNSRMLVYNGEIYNHIDLKNDLLQSGRRFLTNSDTEVLFEALDHWGVEVLERLNGMYALAYFDQNLQRLILARDPMGMKPLYYYESDQYLICSSEINGLLSSGLVPKELNRAAVQHYLNWGYAPTPQTFYKNILELHPGGYLNRSHGQSIRVEISESEQSTTRQIHHEKVEQLLLESVLRHMYCDVPHGLFLSGGVDSTLLLALMKGVGANRIPTFSMVFTGHSTHDAGYSRKAAREIGSDHHEMEVALSDLNRFDEFVDRIDQPVADSGSFLTYLMAEQVRKSVKVVLSGAGADELFAGYNRHIAYLRYLKYHGFFTAVSRIQKAIDFKLPVGFIHPFRERFRLMNKFMAGLDSDAAQTFSNFSALQGKSDSTHPGWSMQATDHFEEDHLTAALGLDRAHYLVSDVLAVSDHSTMAHGLEMRMPYLDREVRDYLGQVPHTHLLQRGPKWILKEILGKHVSKSFLSRSKEGFGLPLISWLRDDSMVRRFGFIRDPDNLVFTFTSAPEIRQLFESHMAGRDDHSRVLWAVLILHSWLENHFD